MQRLGTPSCTLNILWLGNSEMSPSVLTHEMAKNSILCVYAAARNSIMHFECAVAKSPVLQSVWVYTLARNPNFQCPGMSPSVLSQVLTWLIYSP